MQIVRFKDEIIDGCKRGVNACLHDKPASKAKWRCLDGAKVDQSHLETVSRPPYPPTPPPCGCEYDTLHTHLTPLSLHRLPLITTNNANDHRSNYMFLAPTKLLCNQCTTHVQIAGFNGKLSLILVH